MDGTRTFRATATDESPLQFPCKTTSGRDCAEYAASPTNTGDAAANALAALDDASRRMEDLARNLNCLGFFNDDDDRPRAA